MLPACAVGEPAVKQDDGRLRTRHNTSGVEPRARRGGVTSPPRRTLSNLCCRLRPGSPCAECEDHRGGAGSIVTLSLLSVAVRGPNDLPRILGRRPSGRRTSGPGNPDMPLPDRGQEVPERALRLAGDDSAATTLW